MKNVILGAPAFAFIVGTRAALAAGIALLVSDRLPGARRRAVGAALVAIGAATTIPAALALRKGYQRSRRRGNSVVSYDERLIGATRFPRKGDDDEI